MDKALQGHAATQKRTASKLDWRRKMSDHVAYALLVYTGLQIWVTMGALKEGLGSVLPYFALIMLVVGASLARAFGIVGAANLIRYRSKIEDPKDAVVMLCTLAVGLSTGVGLYGLALVGTLFIGFALWVIESFEPQTRAFELAIKLGDKTAELRPEIERVLRQPPRIPIIRILAGGCPHAPPQETALFQRQELHRPSGRATLERAELVLLRRPPFPVHASALDLCGGLDADRDAPQAGVV